MSLFLCANSSRESYRQGLLCMWNRPLALEQLRCLSFDEATAQCIDPAVLARLWHASLVHLLQCSLNRQAGPTALPGCVYTAVQLLTPHHKDTRNIFISAHTRTRTSQAIIIHHTSVRWWSSRNCQWDHAALCFYSRRAKAFYTWVCYQAAPTMSPPPSARWEKAEAQIRTGACSSMGKVKSICCSQVLMDESQVSKSRSARRWWIRRVLRQKQGDTDSTLYLKQALYIISSSDIIVWWKVRQILIAVLLWEYYIIHNLSYSLSYFIFHMFYICHISLYIHSNCTLFIITLYATLHAAVEVLTSVYRITLISIVHM